MLNALKENSSLQKVVSWLSLFSSFGTLICCAIPSTLVLVGLGASLSNFLGVFPQLIWPSEHKEIVFGLSFFMLFISFVSIRYAEKLSCPIDKKEDCQKTRAWSRPLLYTTLVINLVGAFYAFLLPRLLYP
jgi:hypothetical protein